MGREIGELFERDERDGRICRDGVRNVSGKSQSESVDRQEQPSGKVTETGLGRCPRPL